MCFRSALHSPCALPLFPSVLHHPPDLSVSVLRMSARWEQNARALCRDFASQSDKIAVVLFMQNQHSVFLPIYTYTGGIFVFIDTLLLFILAFHGAWNAKMHSLSLHYFLIFLSENDKKCIWNAKQGFQPCFLCGSKDILKQYNNGFATERKSDKLREEIEILQAWEQANRMITTVLTSPLTHSSSPLQLSGLVMVFLAAVVWKQWH